MVARGGKAGPLFMWKDGRFLTIGAATTAAQCGLQDALIKTLGRWESSAYTRYIRTSADTLRKVARTLMCGGVGGCR